MKTIAINIALLLIFISVSTAVNAQVNITYTNTGDICQGNTVQFNDPSIATSFNFNTATNSFPSGWTATGFEIGTPCTVNSNDNSDYFWASAGAGERYVETNDVDVSSGGTISFDIRYGNDDPEPGCEKVDSGEHVTLEYSTNGGTDWIQIQAYTSIFYTWQVKSVAIPEDAQTTSTRFRWIQYNNSSTGYDNWGLDDIVIGAETPAVQSYYWTFGDGGTSTQQSPAHTYSGSGNHTVTVLVTYTNSTTDTDTEVIYINPTPSVSLNTPSPVCEEASAITLTGGSPSGGTYSGPGVSGSTFYPASANIGNNTITYSYTSSAGCVGTPASSIIHVNATPTTTFGSVTPNPVHLWQGATLSGGSPVGGTYSGNGVSGTSFDPSTYNNTSLHPLTYTLYYSYTDGNSCTGISSQNVSVVDNTPVLNLNQSTVPNYYMLTAAVQLFPALTITDTDGGYIDAAYVRVVSPHNSTADYDNLYYTSYGGVTGSYNTTTGYLNLSGHASLSDYQDILRSVTYANTGSAFPEETRTIQVQITSNTGGSDTGNGSVNIVPNQRPIVLDDGYDVYEDNYILNVAADGVLSNDYDPDAFDNIHAVLENGPYHSASFNLNADGSFTYEPENGFVGIDYFTYFANDNKINSAIAAQVIIQVLHPTWDGNGDWADPASWNGTIDPSESLDSVLINNGTATIGTANAQVRVITLTGTGSFQAQNGYYIQIDDALRNNMRRVVSLNSPMQVHSSIDIPMDNPPLKSDAEMICVSGSSLLHINGTYFLDEDGIYKMDASCIGYRNCRWEIWNDRLYDGKALFINTENSNELPLTNWKSVEEIPFNEPELKK